MTFQIPKNEPAELRAGDTWEWRREDLSDYPASTWALTYRFKNSSGGFEVVATADGDLYAVSVAAATTAAYTAGTYQWQAQVVNGSEKHTVENGTLTVLASFFATSATTAYDYRSHAQKALDAINAQLESRATADQREYEINVGGSMRRVVRASLQELIAAKQYYETLVASELAQQRATEGLPDPRRSYVRFGALT